jgi:uncharacterized tellurite resistance protein B-like protein
MLKKILDALGLAASPGGDAAVMVSPAVQAVADRLEGLEPERARLVAALALVLARAARADMESSERELAVIATILQAHAGLTADQADLVTEMISHRHRLFGVSDAYVATREFKRLATAAELECILRCLFAVCAADDSIALVEEEEVRQVASELGFTHEQFVAARSAYRDQREVLRGLARGRSQGDGRSRG